MRVITIVRKPVPKGGTIVSTCLQWSTGGLNIDACRLFCGTDHMRGVVKGMTLGGMTGADERVGKALGRFEPGRAFQATDHPGGRWPANLILCHSPHCHNVGTSEVTTNTHYPARRGAGSSTCGPSGHQGQAGLTEARPGVEYQDRWDCHPDCPVFLLDQQTGVLQSGSGTIKRATGCDGVGNQGFAYGQESRLAGSPQIFYGDAGGASRFFKQVQSIPSHPVDGIGNKQVQVTSMATLPQDLVDYLLTLISPPPPTDPAVFWESWKDTTEFKDNSLTGILLTTDQTVTEEQAKELNRILMPGAHLLMVNPDDDPTGALGACEVEDAGLEIRDTILLLQPGDTDFHYVAKAGRSEREAGCRHLQGRTGAEAVERKEGSAGLDNPRAGAGRNIGKENVRYKLKDGLPEDTVVMIHDRLIEAGIEFDVDAFMEEGEDVVDEGTDPA